MKAAGAVEPLSKLVPSGQILGGTPFRLYTLVAAWRATGRLLLTDTSGTQWEIFFRHGSPELVQTSDPDLTISNYLLKKGVVDEATMEDGLSLGVGLVEALCGAGVLSLEQAQKFLGGYSRALLVRALAVEEGIFSWEVDAPRPSLAIPLGDRWKLLSAVGRRLKPDSVERRLEGLKNRPITRVRESLVPWEALGLHPQEVRIAAAFDGTRTLAGLAAANPAHRELIFRTAAFLAAAGLVTFGAQPVAPAVGKGKAPERAAEDDSAIPAHVRSEIESARSFLKTIEGKDLFGVLGLERNATANQIREAYFALARTFHPDTAGKGSSELTELKQQITARINEAYHVLGDDARRAEYLASGGEAVDIGPILEAEQVFQRAMLLIKVRRFQDALAELDRAIGLNPNEAEFYAYRGLAMYFAAPKRLDARRTAMEQVEKALQMNERCAVAHLVAARIATVAGDKKEAIRQYESCLRLDPSNRDAQRELQRLQARRGS